MHDASNQHESRYTKEISRPRDFSICKTPLTKKLTTGLIQATAYMEISVPVNGLSMMNTTTMGKNYSTNPAKKKKTKNIKTEKTMSTDR